LATEIPTEIVVIVAAIIGTAARTLYPYWEKARENPDIVFERKFLGTALVSFVSAVAIGVGLFPSLLDNVADSGLSQAAVFATVALMAFGIDSGSNMLLSKKTTSGTTTTTTTT
jgi:hypothetical protein